MAFAVASQRQSRNESGAHGHRFATYRTAMEGPGMVPRASVGYYRGRSANSGRKPGRRPTMPRAPALPISVQRAKLCSIASQPIAERWKGRSQTRRRVLAADMLTTSASGLDPDISPRTLPCKPPAWRGREASPLADIDALVARHVTGRALRLFGEPRVNVLELNLALQRAYSYAQLMQRGRILGCLETETLYVQAHSYSH